MYASLLTLESLVYVTVAVTDCPRPWECTLALTQYELQKKQPSQFNITTQGNSHVHVTTEL